MNYIEALRIDISTIFDDSGIKELMEQAKKAAETIKKTDVAPASKAYKSYVDVKKNLDSGSYQTFEDYEAAKTVVEIAENDKRLKSYIDYKGKEEERAKKQLQNLESLGKKMSLFITAPLAAAGGLAVKSASKIEGFTASFTTLLGTEQKAKSMISTLNKMAASTPFDPDPLIKSTEKLLAFGIEAEEVEATLSMLGDSSKGSAEALDSLSTAYGKAAAKGKASMEELNIMIDRGVPILQTLADQFGVTQAQIIEMTAKGQISFASLQQAFQSMTSEGGVFYKGMETASQTLSGKISTLKGNINLLGAGLAEQLLPVIKGVVDSLNGAVKRFGEMDEGMKAAVLTTGGIAAAAGPAIVGITKMINVIRTLTAAQIKSNIAAMANPYVALAAGITAIVGGLAAWAIKQGDVNAKLKDSEERLKKTKNAMKEYSDALTKINSGELEKGTAEYYEAQVKLAENLKEIRKAYGEAYKEAQKYLKDKALFGDTLAELEEKEKDFEISIKVKKNILTAERDPGEELSKEFEEYLSKEIYKYSNKLLDVQKKIAAMRKIVSNADEMAVSYAESLLNAKQSEEDALSNILSLHKEITEEKARQLLEEAKSRKAEKEEKEKPEEKPEEPAVSTEEKEKIDSYERLKKAHSEYLEYKEKLDSGFLDDIEKPLFQKELEARQASYEEWEEYLKSREKPEITPDLDTFEEYIKKSEELLEGQFNSYQEYIQLRNDIEEIYNEANLASYIDMIEAKVAAGKTLEKREEELYERFKALSKETNEKIIEDTKNRVKEVTEVISQMIKSSSGYFVTSFQLAEDTVWNSAGHMAEGAGNIARTFSDMSSIVVGGMGDVEEKLKKAVTEEEKLEAKSSAVSAALQAVAAGLQAAGQMVSDVLSSMVSDLDDQIAAVNDAYDTQIAAAEDAYQKEKEALQKWQEEKLAMLEGGYSSEMEAAEAAYAEALEALETFQDEETEKRQEQLEEYKEALSDRNDRDIEAALAAKERELQAAADKKRMELQANADTAKAELDKQKILKESANKESEIEYQKELAAANAENERLKRTHQLEVEQFNLKKTADLASIWINVAAGTVAAFAQGIGMLGPVAGSIAGAVAAAALTAAAGVQTGLIGSQQPPAAPTMAELPQPPAKYLTGGVIPGNDTKDSTLLFASSGERVLTQRQNESFERLVEAMENGGSSGGDVQVAVHVYIDSSEISIKKQLIEIQKEDRWRRM